MCERVPQPGFVVGQDPVEEILAGPVQYYGMVAGFSGVQTDENVYILLIQNRGNTRYPVRALLTCAG